jgi:lipopolysaccharide exporter
MAAPGTGSAIVGGFAWMLLARIADRLLGIVSIAITARWLAPAEFGTFQMALSVVMLVEMFSLLGFEWSLIRHPDPRREHYDTAFTLQLLLCVITTVIVLLLAYPFAIYYRAPELLPVIMVLAFAPLAHGLENLAVAHLRREGRFEADFLRMFVPRVLGVITCIILAVWLQSHWALIAGYLVLRFGITVIGYALHDYRPRLSLEKWRELMRYSIWLQLNSVLDGARTRCTDLVVGRWLGSHSLALHNMASELASLPIVETAGALNTAVFPTYSRQQDDKSRVRGTYLDIATLTLMVGLPIAIGLAFVAPAVVRLLLGPQWAEAAPLLQVISFGALAGALGGNTGYVLMCVGRPSINAVLSALGLGVLVTLLLLLTPTHGLIGAAVAVTAANIGMLPVHVIVLKRLIGLSVGELLRRTWRSISAAAALTAALSSLPLDSAPEGLSQALQMLALGAVVGGPVYVGSLWLLWLASGRPDGVENTMLRMAAGPLQSIARRLGRT